jgi:hypothetical protein
VLLSRGALPAASQGQVWIAHQHVAVRRAGSCVAGAAGWGVACEGLQRRRQQRGVQPGGGRRARWAGSC